MQDHEWMYEPVAGLTSDPLYALMLERGELQDTDNEPDSLLSVREQAALHMWLESLEECVEEHSATVKIDVIIQRAAKMFRNSVRKGTLTREQALLKLYELTSELDDVDVESLI